MAMHAGMGVSKLIFIIGAGYTGTLMLQNGKLSDVLGELQALVKGYEARRGEGAEDTADAIAAQIRRLAMDVRQLASNRQITVLNADGGVNATSLVVPAAALGAVGYGYMWWKGLSFSDLMYVTKKNMEIAVSSMKQNLEQLSENMAKMTKMLSRKIDRVDDKMGEQVDFSKVIRSDINDVQGDISDIAYDVGSLKKLLCGMDGKITSIEDNQDNTNNGLWELCKQFEGMIKERAQYRLPSNFSTANYLTSGGTLYLEGVKEIANYSDPGTGLVETDNQSKRLTSRSTKVKFCF